MPATWLHKEQFSSVKKFIKFDKYSNFVIILLRRRKYEFKCLNKESYELLISIVNIIYTLF
jgi:hypothetical protein